MSENLVNFSKEKDEICFVCECVRFASEYLTSLSKKNDNIYVRFVCKVSILRKIMIDTLRF